MESGLILSRGGLPPFSARGCIQRLMPIEAGTMRRTVNGWLVYTGKKEGHKYRSLIYCEDKAAIALEGIWRGGSLKVGCIQRLSQKVLNLETHLDREPVEGSVCAFTDRQERIDILSISGRKTVLKEMAFSEGREIFISYRPWLDMCITDFAYMTNEWGLKAGWRLELEEI